MTDSDTIAYGRAGRLRAALASMAAEIAEIAGGMVPTTSDSNITGRGDLVDAASQLAAQAAELVTLAALYEHRRGVSWEAIGEVLGISKQAAQQRFAATDKETDDALTEAWLLEAAEPGRTGRGGSLPEGADTPHQTAERLDRWVAKHGGAPASERPVSGHLEPMTTIEHITMVTAGAGLIVRTLSGPLQERLAAGSAVDDRTRVLELGLARRKVQLYERMSLEEPTRLGGNATGVEEIAILLAGARARLADLEAAASKGNAA